jgi:hypothetical protein
MTVSIAAPLKAGPLSSVTRQRIMSPSMVS